jgi:hypothetical protein
MQHQFRVTGGYKGKAKSCRGAWVRIVSIHSLLSVKKIFTEKKKHESLYTGGGGG